MGVDPVAIEGEEGAITMDLTPVQGDNMSWTVECASFELPYVQLDETGAQVPMGQMTAPDGSGMPGIFQYDATFTSEGEHVIICFNGTTRVRERVFAGDIPAYDPSKYQLTAAEIKTQERAKAAKILVTTGRLNG